MRTGKRVSERPERQRARKDEERSVREHVQSGMRPDKFPDSSMSKDQREDERKVKASEDQRVKKDEH